MTTECFKLVTILSEPVLSTRLIELIRSKGASGFTLTEVRGEGSGERNSGEIPEDKTKIEVLVTDSTARAIMDEISEKYFGEYSIIVYSTEVSVIRGSKFRKSLS